jgi:L-lactate dehydrogenase complex protein LldG
MSTDRDKIFTAIKSAVGPLPDKTPYPEWDEESVICRAHPAFDTPVELFAHKLTEASGKYCDSVEDVVSLITAEGGTFGYCDPELAPLFEGVEGISFDTEYDMAKVDDYAFGITRASAGIAESGTIMLKDAETSARLGALAPWVHVAVIKKSDVVASLPEAIQRFGDDPSIIFCTGPSKTADVEGILIQGVHGPGVQVALVLSD